MCFYSEECQSSTTSPAAALPPLPTQVYYPGCLWLASTSDLTGLDHSSHCSLAVAAFEILGSSTVSRSFPIWWWEAENTEEQAANMNMTWLAIPLGFSEPAWPIKGCELGGWLAGWSVNGVVLGSGVHILDGAVASKGWVAILAKHYGFSPFHQFASSTNAYSFEFFFISKMKGWRKGGLYHQVVSMEKRLLSHFFSHQKSKISEKLILLDSSCCIFF